MQTIKVKIPSKLYESFKKKGFLKENEFELADENTFTDLLKNYDWYYEMSDDPRIYDRGKEVDNKLRELGKKIGIERAVELFNSVAPKDRQITASFFGSTLAQDFDTLLKNKKSSISENNTKSGVIVRVKIPAKLYESFKKKGII